VVETIIEHRFIDDVAEVQRKNDRFFSIKIMIGGEIVIVVNAYALQIRHDISIK
jgi:hypothetical protein